MGVEYFAKNIRRAPAPCPCTAVEGWLGERASTVSVGVGSAFMRSEIWSRNRIFLLIILQKGDTVDRYEVVVERNHVNLKKVRSMK